MIKKISFVFITVFLIGLVVVSLSNKPAPSKNINGTYSSQDNSSHSISFDVETGEYFEDLYISDTLGNVGGKGDFLQKNGIVIITSGKYIDYNVELKNDILILSKDTEIVKFNKISDVPIINVE